MLLTSKIKRILPKPWPKHRGTDRGYVTVGYLHRCTPRIDCSHQKVLGLQNPLRLLLSVMRRTCPTLGHREEGGRCRASNLDIRKSKAKHSLCIFDLNAFVQQTFVLCESSRQLKSKHRLRLTHRSVVWNLLQFLHNIYIQQLK